jgi:hypothetical protein
MAHDALQMKRIVSICNVNATKAESSQECREQKYG